MVPIAHADACRLREHKPALESGRRHLVLASNALPPTFPIPRGLIMPLHDLSQYVLTHHKTPHNNRTEDMEQLQAVVAVDT